MGLVGFCTVKALNYKTDSKQIEWYLAESLQLLNSTQFTWIQLSGLMNLIEQLVTIKDIYIFNFASAGGALAPILGIQNNEKFQVILSTFCFKTIEYPGSWGVPRIVVHPKPYYFCELKLHAKFRNPTITPSGRKVSDTKFLSFFYCPGFSAP
jgi:hypothetical protein